MRAVLLIGALAGAILIAEERASAGPCDEALSPSPDSGPDGYRERAGGERCEGIYVSPVSGTPVELLSLTRGRLSYDLAHPVVLSVSLDSPPPNEGVHVRAVGVPDRLYYQMDAEITGDRAVSWPLGDVPLRRRITSDQVGIFAFRKNASAEIVFLPVDVTPAGVALTHDQPVVATLRAIDVADLKWRFVPKGQEATASFATVPVSGDRGDVALSAAGGPAAGILEVRWNDPGSGRSRTRTFLIGSGHGE